MEWWNWNNLNEKDLHHLPSSIETEGNARKCWGVCGGMEKLGVMDEDVVTQLLTELDKAAIFFMIGASGVWVVEGVASSISTSSIFHLPRWICTVKISQNHPFQFKLISLVVKLLSDAVHQLGGGWIRTLFLQNVKRFKLRCGSIFPSTFDRTISAKESWSWYLRNKSCV